MGTQVVGLLILAIAAHGATLRQACGGPGGSDAAGNVWTADPAYPAAQWVVNGQGLAAPYRHLRFGTSFSYSFALAPGVYSVTLKLIEPNAIAAGKRKFNVLANGAKVVDGIDLFAAAGLLRPTDWSFQVSVDSGQLKLSFAGVLGNAVVSGIQIDPVPPSSSLVTLEKCTGSGPGWDCSGLWRATVKLQDGFTLVLLGPAMIPTDQPGVIWTRQ